MHSVDKTQPGDLGSRSDDGFQRLLLEFSEAAAIGTPSAQLIQRFCRVAREYFQVDGVYFWRCTSSEEFVGAEADGLMADEFRGRRLRPEQSAVTGEAIRQRKTVFNNQIEPGLYPMAGEFHARSMMAAPLVVANEVIGAAVFLSQTHEDFFDQDSAAKATILAGQIGSLLEANRQSQISREEHRRTEILTEVAQVLHSIPNPTALAETLAEQVRSLLRTPLVCVALRSEGGVRLAALAAESPEVTQSIRTRYDRKGLRFVSDIVSRVQAAGSPISVEWDASTFDLGFPIPSGMLLAAPLRTSRNEGAILVYPREEGNFHAEDLSLLSAISALGAVAVTNAELCATAQAQSRELEQLLEISSELSSIGDFDQFMQQFALRAADFLGFGRCFLGLLEGGQFHVRWGAEAGRTERLDITLPPGPTSTALLNREPFWFDDATQIAGANLEMLASFNVRQMLTVPLLDTEGQVLGMFGVLDRQDGGAISEANVRSARALAAQVSVALVATRNLHRSEQHRRRSESLMALSRELNSQLSLPEFARSFVTRAAELTNAESAVLAVKQENSLQAIVTHGNPPEGRYLDDLLPRLETALADTLTRYPQPLLIESGDQIFGRELSARLGWNNCIVMRLNGVSGDVVGVLCLANRGTPLEKEDEQLLAAIGFHASVGLENARLFTRMERASRHWVEIFDAITDFIVAHDQFDCVLRVNRSLADFIGIAPHELVGVKMGALLATGSDAPSHACPFCRNSGADGAEEYVLPVLDRTYLVSTSRVHGATNEGLQTIHVLKDITDRREAERRYRELFDNIQEGVFFATPDGRFVEVNDALVRMLGYGGREDLLQADIRRQVFFSAEGFEEFTADMDEHGAVRNHEQTLRRVDGAPVHVLVNAFAVRDAQQRIVQYRGVMLDISGLRTFQSELQRERDFSGKILNNTQSLILVTDTAGLVSYANRRWFEMGFHQHELLGKPLEGLIAVPRRAVFHDAFTATVAGQQVDNLELQIVRGEGRVGHFSVNLSPMRDEQGEASSIVVVMSDITDAATLQAKLLHAEKLAAVGQLVSGVAHEVNNPLTAILGFADLLLENPELPESARRDMRVILQEAHRTKQIVQNLLSFARQMPPQRNPLQINAILRRTVQLRAYDFHSHGVEVVEQLGSDVHMVVGDSHQLQQVFLNIMNNAYDAVRDTGRPPHIEIKTTNVGGLVEVQFRDNGCGIAFPERIFDPFFTTKEVGKGTGLGLSICYGIVREHGGEIFCENNAEADGATFTVRLPAVSELVSVKAVAGVTQQ